jgi:hypothetical protein
MTRNTPAFTKPISPTYEAVAKRHYEQWAHMPFEQALQERKEQSRKDVWELLNLFEDLRQTPKPCWLCKRTVPSPHILHGGAEVCHDCLGSC